MKRLEHSEIAYAASGIFPIEKNSDYGHQATFLRLVSANYRASEALARMDSKQRIPLARALIARGKINEALEIVSDPKLSFDSGESAVESRLETARVFANLGRWNDALVECGKILSDPHASLLTRAAALQVRATAWFETLNYSKALIDLDQLEDLCTLIPRGQIAFYSKIIRVKAVARTEGVDSARKELQHLLRIWRSSISTANIDEAFTFVRLALDLSRLAGNSHADLALASVNLAKALGDETYAGLGYLDLWASLPESERSKVLRPLNAYLESQPRVASVYQEMQNPTSLRTDNSLRLSEALAREAHLTTSLSRHCDTRIDQVLFLNSSILINLTERHLSTVSIQPRMHKVLEAISYGEISKEDLFKRVWQLTNYSSERHDTLVRTAIMRVRKQTGLEILSAGGSIALSPQALILAI